MKLLVISTAPLILKEKKYYAYSPYVKELELWAKYSDEIEIVCPVWKSDRNLLNSPITFPISKIHSIIEFDITTFKNAFLAIFKILYTVFVIGRAMYSADHIHLRCPGNVGLLGCCIQMFFPRKKKTAKYAGNWDLDSIQPISYKIQRWLLRNTVLTKNMQVLVYGKWKDDTSNIKPFFTASYYEKDKIEVQRKSFSDVISIVFVGTLSNGKQPLYAIQLVQDLWGKGYNVQLSIYGDGDERAMLENYVCQHMLQNIILFKGNQNQTVVKIAYIESHFVILPSLSEGWPKVIAEGMFWKCLPIATAVSCVPTMLDNGDRGIILGLNREIDGAKIQELLEDETLYQRKVLKAQEWSRYYTLDLFEDEIKTLVKS